MVARWRRCRGGEMATRWLLPLLCCGVWHVAEKSGRSVRWGCEKAVRRNDKIGGCGRWVLGFLLDCRRGHERDRGDRMGWVGGLRTIRWFSHFSPNISQQLTAFGSPTASLVKCKQLTRMGLLDSRKKQKWTGKRRELPCERLTDDTYASGAFFKKRGAEAWGQFTPRHISFRKKLMTWKSSGGTFSCLRLEILGETRDYEFTEFLRYDAATLTSNGKS
ncbi:hypothetical protein ACLOJK_036182 [Asimina triloba]